MSDPERIPQGKYRKQTLRNIDSAPVKVKQKHQSRIFGGMKISIPFSEYEIKAVRSGGAGGQHVNKVSTRVELYFNVSESAVLSLEQKDLIISKLSSKITEEGILRLTEDTSRSQHTNREAVVKKLHAVIEAALKRPKKRKPTKVPKSVKKKRLENKKRVGETKKLRKRDFD